MRIALLSYRSKQHSGGQGVYVRNLSAGLADLGHEVTIFSGQPYPEDLHPEVRLEKVPSLDLYRDDDPFRTPRLREFRDWIDVLEYLQMLTAAFPEPLTFSLRARRLDLSGFDVVHDNQSLGFGLLLINRRQPFLATIHHPISRDRALDIAAAPLRKQVTTRRWYAFVRMQAFVARRIRTILGVSSASAGDTVADFRLRPEQMTVVPLGVDTDLFSPSDERVPGRLVVVASADSPLKGLSHFLDAAAKLSTDRDIDVQLVSNLDPDGTAYQRIHRGDLAGTVTVHSGISDEELAALISSAQVMVVPSLYEGFSLPAVEAMSCGTPLVASAAGALPEVVGDAGVLVEPGDVEQLVTQIGRLLDDPAERERLSSVARRRAIERFSWLAVARATAQAYEKVIGDHRARQSRDGRNPHADR
ncbi:glycosyltransferase family 4 protein [Aeromicrobium choanae]|uniref:Glycosyltransferase involved in cell wall bisynthesis n=1 Tax=Aeromicrobium choanae TaxID=1736691 RepID=A0A1T4Z2S7_9ACTN|nr:glycosyltransferase family 4 protein [Aeromicrobium choanae]SKB07835.1 Glycosyltransferase involved in cell wall bisynthesis [Aeromicrobium choanae]